MLRDGFWKGLRLHNGRLAFLHQHLERLYRGANIHRDGCWHYTG